MCGFIGIIGREDVAPAIHLGLQALQHRGQDSAGIATMTADGDRFHVKRGLGPVTQAVSSDDLARLVGTVGIGHVRYPTVGKGVLDDTQPFFYRVPGVLMAHNGNLTNYDELRGQLRERSIHLLTRCDVEPALCEFATALMATRVAQHTIEDAVAALREMSSRIDGAFSIVAALELDGQPTLVVYRDPHGIRPGIVGRGSDGSWIAASESVSLDVLNVEMDARLEPAPGEALFLRPGEEPVTHIIDSRISTPCIFEFIYFARPDAVMNGRSVYSVRIALGQELAERIRKKGIEADVVFPVPDTARPAATAVAESLALPLREGFIKNRYSGRTFIMPDLVTRESALRLKLNPLPNEIKGRKVMLVDDSIVRGTTLRRVIATLRRTGAAEVHLAIHAPPVRNPCFYGIDMSTKEELFASRFDEDLDKLEVDAAIELGADSLTYLSVEGLDSAFAGDRCAACFDGVYPRPISGTRRDQIIADRESR